MNANCKSNLKYIEFIYLLQTHFDIVEVFGILMKHRKYRLCTDSHLHVLVDHANQPLLFLGRHVLQHVQ